jgi:hypothetical protein
MLPGGSAEACDGHKRRKCTLRLARKGSQYPTGLRSPASGWPAKDGVLVLPDNLVLIWWVMDDRDSITPTLLRILAEDDCGFRSNLTGDSGGDAPMIISTVSRKVRRFE